MDTTPAIHPAILPLLTSGRAPLGDPGDELLVFSDSAHGARIYTWAPPQLGGSLNWYDAHMGKLEDTNIRWLILSEKRSAGVNIDAQIYAAVETGMRWAAVIGGSETEESLTRDVSTTVAKLGLFLWGKGLREQAKAGPVVIPTGAPFPAAGVITHIGGQPLPTPVTVDAGDTCTAVVEAEARLEVSKLDVRNVALHGDYSMSVVGRAEPKSNIRFLLGEEITYDQAKALAVLFNIARSYADYRVNNDIDKALEVLGLPKDFGR